MKNNFTHIGEIINDVMQKIINKSGLDNTLPIKTGFEKIDKIITGLHPGSLNIIASRPGMGKTTFANIIALNVACNSNK